MDEMGRLANLYKEYRNTGVQFLGICADVYELHLDFGRAKKFSSAAARLPFDIIGTEYGTDVRFTLATVEGTEITASVADAIGGKPEINALETCFIERPEAEK